MGDFFRPDSAGQDDPTVNICVSLIASCIASLPLQLLRAEDVGATKSTDGLWRKVAVNPSSTIDKVTFYHSLVKDLLLYGNSFILPILDSDGNISDLQYIPAQSVSFSEEDGNLIIRVGEVNYYLKDILNFVYRPKSNMPYQGTDAGSKLAPVIANLKEQMSTKQNYYKRFFRPKVIYSISHDKFMESTKGATQEEQTEAYDAFFKKLVKINSMGDFAVSSDSVDVKTAPNMTLAELGLNDANITDKKAICAYFGVPSFCVGLSEFKSSEWNTFIINTITPLCRSIEWVLTAKLITRSDSLYFRFNTKNLYYQDFSSRMTSLLNAKERGIISADELRVEMGFSPTKRSDMQDFTILENYIPTSKTAYQEKLKGEGESLD